MRILPHEQRTEGWYAARRGVPTGSSFGRLITPTGKRSASADAYIDELIAEKLTGQSKFFPTTAAMQHGIDTEPKAREYYEFMYDAKVIEVGLCLHDTIEAGASPDGLIEGTDGILEIKCPQPHTMVKYLARLLEEGEDAAGISKLKSWASSGSAEKEWAIFSATPRTLSRCSFA